MIKYIGSKRTLVPLIRLAASLLPVRTACDLFAGTTRVDGTPEAIDATQTNSSHNYARPDADYLHYDPARTSLSGWGGRAMLGKQTGKWRPNIQVQTYSPGFDVNDVGYMQRVDVVNTHAVMFYNDQDVKKYTREVSIWAGKYQNWNFGRDLVANGVYGNWYVQALNYWYTFGAAAWDATTLDDRKTRGGPLTTTPGQNYVQVGIGNDNRRKVYFEVSTDHSSDVEGGSSQSFYVTTTYRPTTAIKFSVTPTYARLANITQYVATLDDPTATATFGKRYVFARLDQHTLDMGMRAEWTASSRLSFQLYLQPFIASGGYSEYKSLAKPRTGDYTPLADHSSVANPDFNFRSVRGSAVVRWEFRPGSALYVVWNENRSDQVPLGNFRLRRDLGALPDALSKDVFLIKVSYWLPI